jgi:16S rRNA (cytidine1402-2'-O)-methyltransferase
MKGRLYLIPVPIADDALNTIPPQVVEVIKTLNCFLAEDARTARRFLSSLKIFASIDALDVQILNKDTKKPELPGLFNPILSGSDIGLLSESGCPGVADPGAIAAGYAHENNITVVPLVGPSSVLLALMASGLNGQQFCFHGYLPVEQAEVAKKIKELERESKTKNQTQIFIETPYRNNSLFENLLKNLSSETKLTVAVDINGKNELIQTQKVKSWKQNRLNVPKMPAVFLFLA